MVSYNKVILIGNLTANPQLKYNQNGLAVANFTLAVNSKFATKDQNTKEEVGFFDIVVFGKQAENCSNYLSKGRSVLVEGRLSMNVWEDNEGKKKKKINIVASKVQFLTPKNQQQSTQEESSEMDLVEDVSIEEDIPF